VTPPPGGGAHASGAGRGNGVADAKSPARSDGYSTPARPNGRFSHDS
jgi:hypothetical protein